MQSFMGLGVLVWFEINETFIGENLCENRDKPGMHCNGSCVLKDKLSLVEAPQNGSESERIPLSSERWNFFSLFMFVAPYRTATCELITKSFAYPFFTSPTLLKGDIGKMIKPPRISYCQFGSCLFIFRMMV